MYSIDPMMSYGQAVSCYESYAQDMRKQGKKPVTFLRFITGRYYESDDLAGSIESLPVITRLFYFKS